MKKVCERIIVAIVKMLEAVMTALLVIMMVTMFWQVFTRFVVKIPSIWTEEVARAAFVYMAMIGAALGVRKSAHFGMTMLSDLFRGRCRDLYFRWVLSGVVLVSSVLIFGYGILFTLQFGFTRVSPTFLIPMAWLFASAPLSGFFMILFSLYNLIFENYAEGGSSL